MLTLSSRAVKSVNNFISKKGGDVEPIGRHGKPLFHSRVFSATSRDIPPEYQCCRSTAGGGGNGIRACWPVLLRRFCASFGGQPDAGAGADRDAALSAQPFGWTSFYIGDNTGGVWENTQAVRLPRGGVQREWSEIQCALQSWERCRRP
jgi:hypothetical protein